MWLDKLKQMKKTSQLTSQQIADTSGISKNTIDKYFSGQVKDPYLSKIQSIVHAMGFTLDDLDENDSATEIDINKEMLIQNYNSLNEIGKCRLVEYSNDLISSGNYAKQTQNEKRA